MPLKKFTTETTEDTEGQKRQRPYLDRDRDRAKRHLPIETWMNRMDRMLWEMEDALQEFKFLKSPIVNRAELSTVCVNELMRHDTSPTTKLVGFESQEPRWGSLFFTSFATQCALCDTGLCQWNCVAVHSRPKQKI